MQQQAQQMVASHLPQVTWWEVLVPMLAFVGVIVLPCLFALWVIGKSLISSGRIHTEA